MDSNNFKLLNKIEYTNKKIFLFIDSIPRKEIIIRDNVKESCFNLVKYSNLYNLFINKNKKLEYLTFILGEISILNYYINYLFDNHYISKKIYNDISYLLREERMMTYGLINYNKIR